MDHCVRHSHDLLRRCYCVCFQLQRPCRRFLRSPAEFFRRLPCSIGSAEVESWILLFFCFFWALSSCYYCCETIDWLLSGVEGVASLGGIVLIDFLWRQVLRKNFSSLFCRKETKQASKGSSCGSVSQVFFFFSPTVCFFSGRTFCLASLWRSCFSVR